MLVQVQVQEQVQLVQQVLQVPWVQVQEVQLVQLQGSLQGPLRGNPQGQAWEHQEHILPVQEQGGQRVAQHTQDKEPGQGVGHSQVEGLHPRKKNTQKVITQLLLRQYNKIFMLNQNLCQHFNTTKS